MRKIKIILNILLIVVITCLCLSICRNAYRAKDYTCRADANLIYDYSEEGELPYKYVYGFVIEFDLKSYRRLGNTIPVFFRENDTSIVYIEYNKFGFKKISSYVRKLF